MDAFCAVESLTVLVHQVIYTHEILYQWSSMQVPLVHACVARARVQCCKVRFAMTAWTSLRDRDAVKMDGGVHLVLPTFDVLTIHDGT